MREVKVGLNCNQYSKNDECECDRHDFPYGSIYRSVCETITVTISNDFGDYVSWMGVLSQHSTLGMTKEEFLGKFGNRSYWAEDDLHSFKN